MRGVWKPENGVVLPTGHDCRRLYRDDWLASLCEREGIPTGEPIPAAVAALARAAATLSDPAEREPLWQLAHRLLDEAQERMTNMEGNR